MCVAHFIVKSIFTLPFGLSGLLNGNLDLVRRPSCSGRNNNLVFVEGGGFIGRWPPGNYEPI